MAYFATVYPSRTRSGELCQSAFDRMRDAHLARLARRYAGDAEPPRLLDVGCGFGWVLTRLADRFDVYGMDISGHAVQEASARVGSEAVAVGDIQRGVPFDGLFDVVLAINVIEHLEDPEAGIDAIVRSLAPGASVIVHLPTINNAFSSWAYSGMYDADPTHVYRPSARELRDTFESRGLTFVRGSFWPHAPASLWRHVKLHPAYLSVFQMANGSV